MTASRLCISLLSAFILTISTPAEPLADSTKNPISVGEDGNPQVQIDWAKLGKNNFVKTEEQKLHQEDLEYKLGKKIKLLEETLGQPSVQKALSEYNKKSISHKEIVEIDKKWQNNSDLGLSVESLIDAPCSSALKALQHQDPSFGEIFVTDRRGVNICQTNKTSDYYQADEVWWSRIAEDSDGSPSHSDLEYDQSARSYVFSVYIPILDSESGKLIGISKGVIKQSF